MEYRKLSVDEAEQFWNLMNQLDYETKYMLYEPGERNKNLQRIESVIRYAEEGQDFLLVAETDNKLIGYISAQRGRLNRIAHSAYIVVGILKDYRGKGIGTEFIKRLNVWAEENNVIRLELTVICENEAAKHLYINSGFEIEGIKRKSVFADESIWMNTIWQRLDNFQFVKAGKRFSQMKRRILYDRKLVRCFLSKDGGDCVRWT